MANGFITLENGEDFSVRWTGYDEIIRIAIKELALLENGSDLSQWLNTIIPQDGEGAGDAVFFNKAGDMVQRIIDVRGLTKTNRQLFWKAIEIGTEKLAKLNNNYADLNFVVMDALIEKHAAIIDNIKIIEESENFIVIANDVIEKIGPGWKR